MNKKIFCIGFNKTGTSSLHQYFINSHLSSIHNMKWAHLSNNASDNDLINYINKFDCLCDGEQPDFIRLNTLYPNSNFILTIRPMKSWLESRIKWILKIYPKKRKNGLMDNEFFKHPENAIKKWINDRNTYHKHVMKYFKNKNNLLVIDLTLDKNWNKTIGNFCNISNYSTKKFHNNKNLLQNISKEHQFIINKYI